MQKRTKLFLLALFLLVACPMFGQTPGGSGMGPGEVKFLGGMIGLGIAGGLCGIGQGKAVAGAPRRWRAIREPRAISGSRCCWVWCSLKP